MREITANITLCAVLEVDGEDETCVRLLRTPLRIQ